MAGSVLLDSDAAIQLLRGDDAVRRRLAGTRVFLSAIGLGELSFDVVDGLAHETF